LGLYPPEAFYIVSSSYVDVPEHHNYDPINEPLRDAQKVGVSFKYISPEYHGNEPTLFKALTFSGYEKKHNDNECWINTLKDLYSDTLLNENKRSNNKKVLARESLLNVLGKTEDNIKYGLTIEDIKPFLESSEYQLELWIFFIGLSGIIQMILQLRLTKFIKHAIVLSRIIMSIHVM
jgi:hypothetical protein